MAVPEPEAQAPKAVLDPAPRSRLLFFMNSINFDRHFEAVLREFLGRGHVVHAAFEVDRISRGGDDALFESLRTEYQGFSYGLAPQRRNRVWTAVSRWLRFGIDYLRYLEPEFQSATASRARAARRAKRTVPLLVQLPLLRGSGGRRVLDSVLRALNRATPIDRAIIEFVARHRPDAVLVTPLVSLGSLQEDYVRCARLLGVPSALLVASWDNLTNKGIIREHPDLVVVWNEAQRREAVELHDIPPERVLATGAHTYDHWFDWRPSTTREEFCERVGLSAERPFVLYVGSSYFIVQDEAPFVARWIDTLHRSSTPVLREAGVLIRPHPANTRTWEQHDLTIPGLVAVFPPRGAKPTRADAKADYFDSLYHAAAVVGLNTSALIEAAIVGRPVLSLVIEENRESQAGTLHFAHLASEGGLLWIARDWEDHERQLVDVLTSADSKGKAFLESFIRPRGLDRPAAPLVVDAVEDLAGRGATLSRRAPWQLPARVVLTAAVYLLTAAVYLLFWAKWFARRARRILLPPPVRAQIKRVRNVLKRLRRAARTHVRAIRRFFVVRLRAGVRVRLQRLRHRR